MVSGCRACRGWAHTRVGAGRCARWVGRCAGAEMRAFKVLQAAERREKTRGGVARGCMVRRGLGRGGAWHVLRLGQVWPSRRKAGVERRRVTEKAWRIMGSQGPLLLLVLVIFWDRTVGPSAGREANETDEPERPSVTRRSHLQTLVTTWSRTHPSLDFGPRPQPKRNPDPCARRHSDKIVC